MNLCLGNIVSFGPCGAELTGPAPQQNWLQIKKETKTNSCKKCWGEAKEFLFYVAEQLNLFSYCNIKSDFFLLIKSLYHHLLLKEKLVYLKRLNGHVWEGIGKQMQKKGVLG